MGSPGGGYDAYVRALAPHLEKRLGGKIIPTNEPAAGGLVAMNRLINSAPDGLTILLIGGETLVTAQLYDAPGVNYDVRKLTWLARVSSEVKVALVGPNSPFYSFADLVKGQQPVIWAGSGKIDGNADFSAILAHAFDMKSKIIIGYKGTADMNLAIQRGEADGRIVSEESAALYGPSAGMRVLVTLARARAEQFPEVPSVFDSPELSLAKAKLVDWRAGIANLGRLMLVTTGAPEDRVDLLRHVLADVIRDPAFVADVKRVSLSASYASAADVATAIEQAMNTLDQSGLAEIREIALNRYYH
jgi:tripartite-type tricarboxylate transporter receptor subunit TctC